MPSTVDIPGILTTDATPTQVLVKNLPSNSGVVALVMVQGLELATGDHAVFAAIHGGRRGVGSIIQTGSQTPLHAQKSAGAASWTVVFSQSNGGTAVTLTGQVGKRITWQVGATLLIQEALP